MFFVYEFIELSLFWGECHSLNSEATPLSSSSCDYLMRKKRGVLDVHKKKKQGFLVFLPLQTAFSEEIVCTNQEKAIPLQPQKR